MEKKKLHKLSLGKEVISGLERTVQRRIRGGRVETGEYTCESWENCPPAYTYGDNCKETTPYRTCNDTFTEGLNSFCMGPDCSISCISGDSAGCYC